MQVRSAALLTIFCSLLLLVVGSIVHHSGTAIDCSSWPLCYAGPRNPSVFLSNFHRYLGLIVGVLSIYLVYKLRDLSNKKAYYTSIFALVIVVIQGLLGAVTALYRLPTVVSTSHFLLSIIYLCSLVHLEFHLKETELPLSRFKDKWDLKVTDKLSIGMFFILSASLLGAFVRHSDTMGSCGLGMKSVLLCHQSFWPNYAQAQVHMFYRYYSFVAWLIAAYALISVFIEAKRVQVSSLKVFILINAFLLSLSQISGFATVAFYLSPLWSLTHYLVSLLTMLFMWKMYLMISELELKQWGLRHYSFGRDLLSLAKPRLAMLVMLTTIVGIILAPEPINFFKALIGFLGVFLVVAGGCALNCLMEKNVDALMERTQDRPLAAGRMASSTALIFGLGTTVAGVFALFVWVNALTALLSLLASFLYLFAYTPLKQHSVIALYVGAIPGAIPPVMGWTIVMGSMDVMAWFLFTFLFVWQLPHFMAISIYLEKDYSAAKIQVYPNSYGVRTTQWGIVVLSLVLIGISFYPSYISFRSNNAFLYSSVVLGVAFMMPALKLFFIDTSLVQKVKYWAKAYFFGTIIYLPLLLGALIFLK